MSRCFPFRPQDFAGKSASNDALILSIKNQKEKANTDKKKEINQEKVKGDNTDRRDENKQEKDKSNADRKKEKKLEKEKKREKKEKKREKEKSKATTLNENGKRKLASTVDNLLPSGKCAKLTEDGFPCSKVDVASSEQFEKSSVTEEHGNPCCSSDSTENSGKRKRNDPPPKPSCNLNSGTVIRFKFSAQKQASESASLPSATPSLTSARTVGASLKAEPKINASSLPAAPSSLGRSSSVPEKAETKILPATPSSSCRTASVPLRPEPKINNSHGSAKLLKQSSSGPKVNIPPAKSLQQSASGRAAIMPRKVESNISKCIPSPCSTSGAMLTSALPQKADPKVSNSHLPAVPAHPTLGKTTSVTQKSEPTVRNASLPVKNQCSAPSKTAVVTHKIQPNIVNSAGLAKISPLGPVSTDQTCKQVGTSAPDEVKAEVKTKKAPKPPKVPKVLRKFDKLMDNWTPAPLAQELTNDLEDDWLSGGGKEAKRLKSCKEQGSVTCDLSFPMQPRALYLSDVEMYALPFTVPF